MIRSSGVNLDQRIESKRKLIEIFASNFERNDVLLSREDLIQEGYCCLLQAAKKAGARKCRNGDFDKMFSTILVNRFRRLSRNSRRRYIATTEIPEGGLNGNNWSILDGLGFKAHIKKICDSLLDDERELFQLLSSPDRSFSAEMATIPTTTRPATAFYGAASQRLGKSYYQVRKMMGKVRRVCKKEFNEGEIDA